jgi:hypothetical protein
VVVTATTLVVLAASSLGQVLPDIPMLPWAHLVSSVSVIPAAHSPHLVSVSSVSTISGVFAHDLSDAYHRSVF